MSSFASRIVGWQRRHGRHDLPWQSARDPYRIWISEVMLQQTQVATVVAFYERFVARFPTLEALARADENAVLSLWSGLGYYARARNLLRAARSLVAAGREFPATFDALVELPGIGRSTAGAIAAFASGERRPILDGNVRRVLARHAGIGADPTSAGTAAKLWEIAESRLPRRHIEAYTQGLMDLGATVCTPRAPDCGRCPVASDCVARVQNRCAEFPGKRVKAKRAVRRIAMLVVIDRGEVLLERRESRGIWGGLWSLPESAAGTDVQEVAARDWGLAVRKAERLATFVHAFTHFSLEVTPWRIHLRPGRRSGANPRGVWLSLDDLDGAALPSPVRRLLKRSASAPSGTDAGPTGAQPRRSARGASASRRS